MIIYLFIHFINLFNALLRINDLKKSESLIIQEEERVTAKKRLLNNGILEKKSIPITSTITLD